jgi:hypothetical protein
LDAAKSTFPTEIQPEIESFVKFKNWLIPILKIVGNIGQLSQNDLIFLRDIATNGKGKASYQAQNILCFFYNECAEYVVPGDVETRGLESNNEVYVSNEKLQTLFKIHPNPAKEWLNVTLMNELLYNEKINLILTDLSGKIILATTFSTNSYSIDTRHIEAGVYLLSIKSASGIIGTEKVIIQN